LYKPHGPFVADLGVISGSDDGLDTCHYVFPVDSCLLFKELGAPVHIIFVGTAQVVAIGVVVSLSGIAPVQRDPLLVIVHFHRCGSIMDLGLLAYVAVGYAIIAFVGREVHIAHLLYLGTTIVLELVGICWKWF